MAEANKPDYRHAVRPIALLLLVAGAALAARTLFIPPTYGLTGPYRAAAPIEAQRKVLKFVEWQQCIGCHDKQRVQYPKDAHVYVQCEGCHGAGQRHVQWHTARRAQYKKSPKTYPKAPADVHLRAAMDNDFCMRCHAMLSARPGGHPQIDPPSHFAHIGMKKEVNGKPPRCITCHPPHSPLRLTDLRSAKVHPQPNRCRDCHAEMKNVVAGYRRLPQSFRLGAAKLKSPHKSLFDCKACHKSQAKRFESSGHKVLGCTQCHNYLRRGSYAGRIVRDAGSNHCLLCHNDNDYRTDQAPPAVTWPDHREENSESDADKDKRCIDCHRDAIHGEEKETEKPDRGKSEGKQ
ncbi:MAG: hypothetical protein H6707_09455 [Deltaproteobacteria bacterium]|nr:hypothetical protein [Deltaproteobacteria bacterium]